MRASGTCCLSYHRGNAHVAERTVAVGREPKRVADVAREDLKSVPYELFMLALALLSIVNFVLVLVLPWESQSWWLVVYIDAFLTVFFVADFIFRLVTAPSKKRYMGRGGGVLDLLSCSPGPAAGGSSSNPIVSAR